MLDRFGSVQIGDVLTVEMICQCCHHMGCFKVKVNVYREYMVRQYKQNSYSSDAEPCHTRFGIANFIFLLFQKNHTIIQTNSNVIHF